MTDHRLSEQMSVSLRQIIGLCQMSHLTNAGVRPPDVVLSQVSQVSQGQLSAITTCDAGVKYFDICEQDVCGLTVWAEGSEAFISVWL